MFAKPKIICTHLKAFLILNWQKVKLRKVNGGSVRERWLLKVDETAKRLPEKNCSKRTSRKFETLRK